MTKARPFASLDSMFGEADERWRDLAPADYLEAFAAHPKIGDDRAGQVGQVGQVERVRQASQASAAGWSAEEQAGTRDLSDAVRQRLVEGNRAYEARFGYIFILCATGKSAGEMLASLETRLHNAPDEELRIAADEQRQITRLRLAKLVDR
jgi:2-oxo-4-hydroxy-4-carboxy-5-ureidoimidazoline decarboxylase